MASVLTRALNYKCMAEDYANFNALQLKFGEELVAIAHIKPGEKVLDMGCGTGELTSRIAAQVGKEGRVVGVDPDEEKIKIAMRKHDEPNLSFVKGDSSTSFPHFNEEYYDVHFSNCVFHYVTLEEKVVYLNAAAKCLKRGGRITFFSLVDKEPELSIAMQQLQPDDELASHESPFQMVEKATLDSMLEGVGFQVLPASQYGKRSYVFPSADAFMTWYCSACYLDKDKIVPAKRKAFVDKHQRKDGTLYLDGIVYQVVAQKL